LISSKRGLRYLLAAVLLASGGCSLAIDVSELDQGCAPRHKLCGTGHCVAQSDPAYGCTLNGCDPCSLTNSIPDCMDQRCVVKTCLYPFGCENDTGCAANLLVEHDNCGACGHACAVDQTCRNGDCAPSQR
jgi:hypothetical protein